MNLLKAIPANMKDDFNGSRVGDVEEILFKIMVLYQPGGREEIAALFSKLQNQSPAQTAEQALKALRRWERHRERARVLNLAELDPRVQHEVLDAIVKQIREQAPPDTKLRLQLDMMELKWDTLPTKDTVERALIFFKALAVTMSGAGSPKKDPKVKKNAVTVDGAAAPSAQVQGLVAPVVSPKPKGAPPAKAAPAQGTDPAVVPYQGGKGGKGQGKGNQGGKGGKNPAPRQKCVNWMTDAGCNFGNTCNFCHDLPYFEKLEPKDGRCFNCSSPNTGFRNARRSVDQSLELRQLLRLLSLKRLPRLQV